MRKYVTNYRSCNWSNEARNFNYTNIERFVWAVVSIQRSIVLGAVNVRDEDLGDYIKTYGRYLEDKNGHGSQPFNYNKSMIASFPKVTFHDLTRWILTSGENTSAKRHAKAWDNAIQLHVAYRRSLTVSDWDKFVQAAATLQIKK
jgi:hypothetical protein